MTDPDERFRRRDYTRRRMRRQRLVVLAFGLVAGVMALGIGVSLVARGETSVQGDLATLTSRADTETRARSAQTEVVSTSQSKPQPSPAASLRHVRGKVIVIDPGHNGLNWQYSREINRQVNAGTLWKACDTTGTQTNDGYTEAAYNFDVSVRLATILRAAGARVILTRKNNEGWGPCITERAALGNRAGADVAISIHADGGPASGRGFHVIYPPSIDGLTDDIATESRRLAIALRTAFRRSGMPEATYVGRSGINARSDLGGLNLSDVPKVLFETGNMRNATDAALLKSAAFRQQAARATATGLDTFLLKTR